MIKRREVRRSAAASRSDGGKAREARRTADGSTKKKKSAAALGIGRSSHVERAREACDECESSESDSDDQPEPEASTPELKELTSSFELRCDQGAIKYIRSKYSKNVASRLLRMAFAWEAQRLHYKAVLNVRKCDNTEAGKDAAALDTALTAVDMAATTYLVSNHSLKSFYPHNGVFKLPFDVYRLGSEVWGANCSSMEANGSAVLKRIAGSTVRICDKAPRPIGPVAPTPPDAPRYDLLRTYLGHATYLTYLGHATGWTDIHFWKSPIYGNINRVLYVAAGCGAWGT